MNKYVRKLYLTRKKVMELILVNYKKCKICKTNKRIKDFIGKQTECYKCVYKKKLAICRKKSPSRCKECDESIPKNRWSYCSNECAASAKSAYRHWTKRCNVDNKNWKERFMF